MRIGHRTARLAWGSVFAAALMVMLAGPAATATELDPNDFDVQVEMGDGIDMPDPDCDDGGSCTVTVDLSVYDSKSTGTVRAISKDLEGTIRMICDYRHRFEGAFQMTESGPDWSAVDGLNRMGCAWFMTFEDGSTLSGMINGSMDMTLVGNDPDRVRSVGSFTVVVTAGSKVFAGYVGTGTFEEDFTETWGGGAPEQYGPASALRAAFSPSASEPGMQTQLRKTGGFKVKVVTPLGKFRKSDAAAKLRVVAARGATCVARAIKGDVVKRLGTEEDGNRDGIVKFDPALANKLTRGEWTLRVRCSARVAGDRSSARTIKSVTVV